MGHHLSGIASVVGGVFKDCLYNGAFTRPQMIPHQGAGLLGLVRNQCFHNFEMLF